VNPSWLKHLPVPLLARIEHRPNLQKALTNMGWLLISLTLPPFAPAGAVLSQARSANGNWYAVLNDLSSLRTYIRVQGFSIPNQWLGVGFETMRKPE
jgi:hypothetical protein